MQLHTVPKVRRYNLGNITPVILRRNEYGLVTYNFRPQCGEKNVSPPRFSDSSMQSTWMGNSLRNGAPIVGGNQIGCITAVVS